jgi:hypothetical protein
MNMIHQVEIGKKSMSLLEVAPGITMRDVFAKDWPEGFSGNLQIGRLPPLSSGLHTIVSLLSLPRIQLRINCKVR